jgi:hypothetical protein
MRIANQFVRSHQLEWKPLSEPGVTGVFLKVLRFDEETRRAPTILLKFEPGATYPAHNHPGGEEIFVLEGDIALGKDHLYSGDYLYVALDEILDLDVWAVSHGLCLASDDLPCSVQAISQLLNVAVLIQSIFPVHRLLHDLLHLFGGHGPKGCRVTAKQIHKLCHCASPFRLRSLPRLPWLRSSQPTARPLVLSRH